MEAEYGSTAAYLEATWAYFTGERRALEGISTGRGHNPSGSVVTVPGSSRLPHLQQPGQVSRRRRAYGLMTGSHTYSFVQAMRLIESKFGLQGNLASTVDYTKEPVVLVQPSKFSLSPSMLGDIVKTDNDRYRLECHFFGLYGNAGPMPEYICELVRSIELETEGNPNNEQMVFVDFLNLFNHKMLLLFYESWVLAEPVISRFEKRDPYVVAIDSVAGNLATNTSEPNGIGTPIRRRLPYLFCGGRPTCSGLEAVLASVFLPEESVQDSWHYQDKRDGPVLSCKVQQNVPQWLDSPADLQLSLGTSLGSGLGCGVYLGNKVVSVEHCIAIKISVRGLEAYRQLLPGGEWNRLLKDVVLEYLGWEYAVQVWLQVDPQTANGQYSILDEQPVQCALGETAWLAAGTESTAHLNQREVKYSLLS